MPRSSAKPKRSGGAAEGRGGRWLTVGLFVTFVAAAALIGSLAAGLAGGGSSSSGPDSPPAAQTRRGERPDDAAVVPAGQRVRVEVLNASGKPGLASEGRRVLRDHGFDVVQIGNAPKEFGPDSSVILDRVGKIENARAVADSLGIRRVLARPDSNLYLDVSVVLGKDWAPPGAVAEPDS